MFRETRVVQLNRRTSVTFDEAGIVTKFGVTPESIPDYLGLVGDTADGYPGLAGWGAKSTAAVLGKYVHLESIPKDYREWRGECYQRQRPLGHAGARVGERYPVPQPGYSAHGDSRSLRMWSSCDGWGRTAAFPELAARLDAAVIQKKERRSR